MITQPGPWSALVTLPLPPSADTLTRVLYLEHLVLDTSIDAVEIIPAFNRLLVSGRPETWDPDRIKQLLEQLAERVLIDEPPRSSALEEVVLPTCYNRQLAPDLPEIARYKDLSESDIAKIHAGVPYTVLATGFAPGFAYLGDVNRRIALPRRQKPRASVPAGSVGVADQRTGVYPATGPGGWNLIGRVPPSLFADARERLMRFTPGQGVRFRPITVREYRLES